MTLPKKSDLMWTHLTDCKRDIVTATNYGKVIRIQTKQVRASGRALPFPS